MPRQQLISLGRADPADLGQLALIADENVRAMGRLSRHVDHRPASGRVNPAADDPSGPHEQPGLFPDLAHRRIGRALARLDLTGDERPRRLPVLPPANQHTLIRDHDRRNHRLPLGHLGQAVSRSVYSPDSAGSNAARWSAQSGPSAADVSESVSRRNRRCRIACINTSR